MANILLTVWPIETHLIPFLALGEALQARGHEVAFYTGAAARPQLRRAGFRCFPFMQVDSRHADQNPGAASHEKLGWRARKQMWHDFLLGTVHGQIADLEQICQEWHPHAIVCDVTMWGPILVTQETQHVPVAVLSHTAYCLLPGRENPAPALSMPHPRTRASQFMARMLTRGINRATAAIPREASRIRREHGLAPLASTVIDFTGQMPLHMVSSAPEFDYGRDDLPPSVEYVGSGFWTERGQEWDATEWIAGVRGSRPRVVVVEEAHYAPDGFLLKTAARALADHAAEVILIAGQGRDLSTIGLHKPAANVRVRPWLPLRQALTGADVLVAHGNSETVLETFNQGIPMVVVPRMLEQPQVAWRVDASGAGIRLPMRRATPARLRQSVDRVLSGATFGRNAQRIGAALARRGGPNRAAELVEKLAGQGPVFFRSETQRLAERLEAR